MNIAKGNYLSINQIADQYGLGQKSGAAASVREDRTFAEILAEKRDNLREETGLNFSKHATRRLAERNINMSSSQLERLAGGVTKAEKKGINDPLVMVDDLAFIVNTKSQTVVTAMDAKDTKENVFSNIDGVVIM